MNAKVNAKKEAIVAELKERLQTAKGAVFTSYKGLTVAQDTELRRTLREAGVSTRKSDGLLDQMAAVCILETFLREREI